MGGGEKIWRGRGVRGKHREEGRELWIDGGGSSANYLLLVLAKRATDGNLPDRNCVELGYCSSF